MAYPSIQQYQEALQHPAHAFTDPMLAQGRIGVSGLGMPRVLSGGFALTYAVDVGGKKYAVRCFHKEAKNLERRYEAISRRLKALTSPYFVDFEYQPQGVRIGGATYPIVRMAWAAGETLGEFVERNHRNATKLKNLVAALSQLASHLAQAGIAHGDVQDLNLMVSNEGRRIQLIDYDGMFVPELSSLGGSELGHRDYQHPGRDAKAYDATLDRFSFITLNLALRALCERPALWTSSRSGSGVIVFRANDYADPGDSPLLAELSAIPGLRRDVQHFAAVCAGPFAAVPTLAQFVAGDTIPKAAVQIGRRIEQESSSSPAGYLSAYPVLDATDYAAFEKNIGQMVELVGKVVEVAARTTRGGKPYIFVNFGHWRGDTVKINLWSEALAKGGERPSESWVGRWVALRGLVEPVYSSRQFKYNHISISADSVGQIAQLSESEARYRLRAPPARVTGRTTRTNNAAVLVSIQGAATPPPSPPAGATAQSSAVSRNQAVLQGMRSPAPASAGQARNSGGQRYGARPAPPASQRHQPSPAPPRGLLGWLASLFR